MDNRILANNNMVVDNLSKDMIINNNSMEVDNLSKMMGSSSSMVGKEVMEANSMVVWVRASINSKLTNRLRDRDINRDQVKAINKVRGKVTNNRHMVDMDNLVGMDNHKVDMDNHKVTAGLKEDGMVINSNEVEVIGLEDIMVAIADMEILKKIVLGYQILMVRK